MFLTFLPAQPLSPTALSPHQAQSGKLSSMMKEEKKMPVDKSKTRKKAPVDFCQEQCTVRICEVLFDMHPIPGLTGSQYPTRPELFFKYPTRPDPKIENDWVPGN